MIEDKKSGYRNKPNRMSELRLWSFLSCFIREVSAVFNFSDKRSTVKKETLEQSLTDISLVRT